MCGAVLRTWVLVRCCKLIATSFFFFQHIFILFVVYRAKTFHRKGQSVHGYSDCWPGLDRPHISTICNFITVHFSNPSVRRWTYFVFFFFHSTFLCVCCVLCGAAIRNAKTSKMESALEVLSRAATMVNAASGEFWKKYCNKNVKNKIIRLLLFCFVCVDHSRSAGEKYICLRYTCVLSTSNIYNDSIRIRSVLLTIWNGAYHWISIYVRRRWLAFVAENAFAWPTE